MIDVYKLLPVNFYSYGGTFTGEHHNMRYMIRRIGEKPDFRFEVRLWKGPFAYALQSEDALIINTFAYSEQGLKDCCAWMGSIYEEKKAFFEG